MSCGNSRSSKCNPCGPSEAAINAIADRAAYYARIAITASETGGGIRWGYIGDGVATTFNIDGAGTTNSASFLVTIDGVVQDPLDYTITYGSPYTITMNDPVPSGSEIIIVSLNGLTGATGPAGGPIGPVGPTGATGVGATGATGLGATGATGPAGPSGTAAAGGMRWSYTGNGTQTIFNISGASTVNAAAYSVNIDGITQDPNNYTIQSGSPYTLTMSQAVPSNSVIVIVSIVGQVGATGVAGATGPINSGATGATGATGPSGIPYASNFGNVWSYIGNGSQTVFAITGGLSILAPAYLVTIDGVFQKTTNYTINNVTPRTLTFSQPVPNGSEINIISLSVA